MKKWWYPIAAYMVSCPTRKKSWMVSNVQIGGSGSTCRILTLTKSLTKTPTDDTVYDLFDAGVFNQQDPG